MGGNRGGRGGYFHKDFIRPVRIVKFYFGCFGVFELLEVCGGRRGVCGVVGAEFAGFVEGSDEIGEVAAEAADCAVEIEEALRLVGFIEGFGDFDVVGHAGLLGGEGGEDGAFGDLESLGFRHDRDHLFDDAVFGRVPGAEIGDVTVDEDAEAVFAFALEEEAFDEAFEADVFECRREFPGILGGYGFALGRAGAGGEFRVFDVRNALTAGV